MSDIIKCFKRGTFIALDLLIYLSGIFFLFTTTAFWIFLLYSIEIIIKPSTLGFNELIYFRITTTLASLYFIYFVSRIVFPDLTRVIKKLLLRWKNG